MTTTLGTILIAALLGTEVWCGYTLRQILRQRSEERTDNRRAFYRNVAYKDKAEARALKNARQALWRSIEK